MIRLGVTGLFAVGQDHLHHLSRRQPRRSRAACRASSRGAEGRIEAAYLQSQPDDTLAPGSTTRPISARSPPRAPAGPKTPARSPSLRLSLQGCGPGGCWRGCRGRVRFISTSSTTPASGFLDLALLDKSYDKWSRETLARVEGARDTGSGFRAALAESRRRGTPRRKPAAAALARAFTGYLTAARGGGLLRLHAGRFPVCRATSAGSPGAHLRGRCRRGPPPRGIARPRVRAPLRGLQVPRGESPSSATTSPGSTARSCSVDVLGCDPRRPSRARRTCAPRWPISSPPSVPVRRLSLTDLPGRRVERILFAPPRPITSTSPSTAASPPSPRRLLAEAKSRADFAGARTKAMSIAGPPRATTERPLHPRGPTVDVLARPAPQIRRNPPPSTPATSPKLAALGSHREGADFGSTATIAVMRLPPAAQPDARRGTAPTSGSTGRRSYSRDTVRQTLAPVLIPLDETGPISPAPRVEGPKARP